MNNKNIASNITNAINATLAEERPLQSGASERSFAHRIAVHMEPLFEGWNIDCEYNRNGLLVKNLEGIKVCDSQRKTERIYPDIIVHKRTNDHRHTEDENLLVIEVKLNTKSDACDAMKLELMTSPHGGYNYQLGLYINIEPNGEFKKTWYSNGSQITDEEVNT